MKKNEKKICGVDLRKYAQNFLKNNFVSMWRNGETNLAELLCVLLVI